MLEYKRERIEFTDEEHNIAMELTEAINAYINDEKGDEISETLDVATLVGGMLINSANRDENIKKLINGLMLVSLNAGKSALEPKVV